MKLSVIILAKNEQDNIGPCIDSVSFADEILVIDDFSADDTRTIAEKKGAVVHQRALAGNWGEQQTYAFSVASHEWLFCLDADERITPQLAEEVREAVRKNEKYTYYVPRLNHFMGKPLRHGGWYPDYGIHLLPRDGSWVEGFVHPRIHHRYPVRYMKNHLLHYPYRNWEVYFNKFNSYTTLAARKMVSSNKNFVFCRDIFLRPLWAFFRMYVVKRGFLDGRIGLFLAMNHAFYTLNKYIKFCCGRPQKPEQGHNKGGGK